MDLSVVAFPAHTDVARAAGYVSGTYAAPDKKFADNGVAVPSAGDAADMLFPNVRAGAVVSRPFCLTVAAGVLRDGRVFGSDSEAIVLHVDPADKPALLPGDAITGAGYGFADGVVAPSDVKYIGVGVYAFPLYDDGHTPLAINYVPRAEADPGFPHYTRGRCFGWLNAPAGIFGARYPGLSIGGFPGYTRWGINTAYNNGGVVDVGAFVPLANHIVFAVSPRWTVAQAVSSTLFAATVAPTAAAQLAALTAPRKVVGYVWYGHGYWDGADVDPYFVKLGRTLGPTLTPVDARAELADLPHDYSRLFRYPSNQGSALRCGNLGRLSAGGYSDTFLLQTPAPFTTARGILVDYMEV